MNMTSAARANRRRILVPLFSVQQVMRLRGGRFPPVDHYADAVFSEPGRCWRMVHDGEGSGRPTFYEEPVVWVGNHHLVGGKQVRVWSCDGHVEGVIEPVPGP